MEPNATPEIPAAPEIKKDNHWITILAMALFVLGSLATVAFLYYQNQRLKSMLASYQSQPSPSPTATADPTADWKTYTNTKFGYSIKYPAALTIKEYATETQFFIDKEYFPTLNIDVSKNLNPKTEKPYTKIQDAVLIKDINLKERTYGDIAWTYDENNLYGSYLAATDKYMYAISLDNNPNNLYSLDQFLSTFKFLGASPSAEPKACTQEAKLCPDGSYVGREGSNCEFAPCP